MVILFALLTALGVGNYDADLARYAQRISGAGSATERAVYVYHRASLTADFADLRDAETAIDSALGEEASVDMLFLRANFNFKMHRLQRAKDDLARVGDTAGARSLAAQIALQEGDYDGALRGYRAALVSERTWDGLANLAYYEANTGNPAGADRLYVEAEDEITAKEMRSYAWVELQRGLLDFGQRRYAEALAHYRRAEQAYSGYWLIEEHIAEVLDRLGRTDEAVAQYRKVIDQTHNPEYVSALAAIVARTDAKEADRLYAEADGLYDARFQLYPEAAGGHLVRHLLARSDAPLPRLLAVAEANANLRPNAEAKLLLAKAYWKADRPAETERLLQEVKRTPWRTLELAEFEREVDETGSRSSASGSAARKPQP